MGHLRCCASAPCVRAPHLRTARCAPDSRTPRHARWMRPSYAAVVVRPPGTEALVYCRTPGRRQQAASAVIPRRGLQRSAGPRMVRSGRPRRLISLIRCNLERGRHSGRYVRPEFQRARISVLASRQQPWQVMCLKPGLKFRCHPAIPSQTPRHYQIPGRLHEIQNPSCLHQKYDFC